MTLNEVSLEPAFSPRLPVLVVAAALIDARGRVLMQQRPIGKAHAGLWEFPGGKVEAGEAPVDALVRELSEELGVQIAAADATPLAFAADATAVLLLYQVLQWRGEPRALDAAVLTWGKLAALAQLPMPPLDVPLLATLTRRAAGA